MAKPESGSSLINQLTIVTSITLALGCESGTVGTPGPGDGHEQTHSLSGSVSGAVLAGVTMTLSGQGSNTSTTDSGGDYSFAGLANGSYSVTPSLFGYAFDPESRSVWISDADLQGIDFMATALTCTVESDEAFCDRLGKDCGPLSDNDNCGTMRMANCGSCTLPSVCGGGGTYNVCGSGTCTPTTCGAQGKNCGSIGDGCGGTLSCGPCYLPETCGGSGTPNVCGSGSAGVTYVYLSDATVATGGSVQIQATLQPAGSSATDLDWSTSPIAATSPGVVGGDAINGTITTGGVYTPPASPTIGNSVYKVWAASKANPLTVYDYCWISVTDGTVPIFVTVAPPAPSVAVNGTVIFTATVTGTANTAVDWSATCGSILASGVYTAPGSAATCSVTATSVADSSKSDTAVVTVEDEIDPAEVRAFPGAEGYGAITSGGRGGRVIEVTNLNNEGAGSFRAACEASGARIVVFRTGGLIGLDRPIEVREPYITIAGQTAPGDGVCLKGSALQISTHDVIVRGIRSRPGGDSGGYEPEDRDGLSIIWHDPAPYNIIFDHCSVSWGIDENFQFWDNIHDVTVQWTIISEGLFCSTHPSGCHSKGLLLGGEEGGVANYLSLHHNLLAHNDERNPRVQGNQYVELVNNVVYDWGAAGLYADQPEGVTARLNIIGNLYQPGASTYSWAAACNISSGSGETIFVLNNIGPERPSSSLPQWAFVSTGPSSMQRSAPWPASSIPITIQAVDTARDLVLANAGAITPRRDSVDTRVVQQVKDGTGQLIDSQNDVGGWPSYSSGTAPTDSDHDGMPDTWETAHGLNPSSSADGNTLAPSGYTWVEEYINSLIPMP